jgi:hypothetical protein
MVRFFLLTLFLCATFCLVSPVLAHGGKTNAKGCHAGPGGKVHCHAGTKGSDGAIKKGADGKCYPPSHPSYKKIKAVKTYKDFKACHDDK